MTELQTLLSNNNCRIQAMEIIRSLIERIEVSPGPVRGECDVVLVGALAGILGFAAQKNTAVPYVWNGGMSLMVAGARCDLYRTSEKP